MTNTPKHSVSRRSFFTRTAGLGAALAGGTVFGMALNDSNPAGAATTTSTNATAALSIPTLLSPTVTSGVSVYALDMETGTHDVLAGTSSSTYGFNGSYLGPTMQWTNGESVQLNITNNLGAESTVHFHGAHVPAKYDGGPQLAFASGSTWSPAFTVNQEAATLWYHPHALGTTAEQIAKGLAGMIIVSDSSTASADLPSDYGVDDIPIILQCLAVDSSGDIKYNLSGYNSSSSLEFPVICNGTNVDATTLTFTATKKRTRVRFLNASLADIITVSRTDGGTMTQIATEQGYLNASEDVTSIRLVAGERAEVYMELTAAVTLQAVITTGWVKGGSGTYDFLTITPSATDTPVTLPTALNTITRYDTSSFTARTINLQASGTTMEINGVAGTTLSAMTSNMITTTVGSKEIWTINNTTQLEHSFHLHDVPFQIISVNGTAPTGAYLGWKDIVEVTGGSVVKIAMEFTDYYDTTYMYMLHCHIAPHEDEGMMLGLMVES
ncbi:multicopper oxidase family protein [Streptacidiphilus sp. EB103A]|uniref:multicopper oxidase family protein n=1 Tax=Streptacidiphilus sp. EB103A TaxID=3156275 RepID=UPI0035188B9B